MSSSIPISSRIDEINTRIRQHPADASHRVALAQLRAATADYAKALQQIQVAAKLDPTLTPTAQVMRLLIRAEHLRNAVFAGKARPSFVAEPPPWLEPLLLALQSPPDQAQALRQRAMDAAPESPGSTDGLPFAWIADGDCRLGPVFEVILSGAYHWIPIGAVARLRITPPAQLMDLVWAPVMITLVGAAPRPAFMSARYPVAANPLPDDAILLGRRTEWAETAPDMWCGHGLRTWYAGEKALPLFEVSEIVFGNADHVMRPPLNPSDY